jgi:branched-chain amino acid transport system ATP-binding protein
VADRVDQLIERFGLGPHRNRFIAELSTGTRRMVDLAGVVAHSPTVLLLDEPSSGIAQRESEALGPLIKLLRDELGCTILVVEHDMPLLRGIADRLVALDMGSVVTDGAPDEVLTHPAVIESYLGTSAAVIARSGARS